MTSRLGVFLDWSLLDFFVLGIAAWQYVSISRDIKRTKAKQQLEQGAGHAERQEPADPGGVETI